MLFFSRSLGIDITPAGIACVLVSGKAAMPRLERVAYAPLPPGVLKVSLREANIADPGLFSDRLTSAHNLLLTSELRASVTIPDAVGRVMIIDIEGRFKSRSEALDIIRWKLKKNIPFDLADTHLDYQQLQVRENGDMSLMVALVSRGVIGQYEDLLCQAGMVPARIEFTLFSLCRAFEQRLALQEDQVLVYYRDSVLGVIGFAGGQPEYVRTKELSGVGALDGRVFMELNSSLLVYRERLPERQLTNVFCVAAPDLARDFSAMVTEATGIQPVLLEAKSVVRPSDAAPGDQETLFPFTAAIGAAIGGL